MLLYVAGPIDFAAAVPELWELRNLVTKELVGREDIASFDPTKPFTNAGRAPEQAHRINQAALAEADAVLALCPPGVPSIGTPMEILQAHQRDRPVAVLGGFGSMQLTGLGVERFDLDEGGVRAAFEWLTLSVNGHRLPRGDLLKWTGDQECQPVRHYGGDAGWDLVVSEETRIPFGGFADVPCGINVELPAGTWAMITGRSSTLRKRQLLVSTGIIDNGYTGPLYAGTQNLGDKAAVVGRGERIAQLIPFPLVSQGLVPWQVDSLGDTDRGASGFGSTGT